MAPSAHMRNLFALHSRTPVITTVLLGLGLLQRVHGRAVSPTRAQGITALMPSGRPVPGQRQRGPAHRQMATRGLPSLSGSSDSPLRWPWRQSPRSMQ